MDQPRPPALSALAWARRFELVGQFLLIVGCVFLLALFVVSLAVQGDVSIPDDPTRITFACFSLGTALTGVGWLLRAVHPGSLPSPIVAHLQRNAITPRQYVAEVAIATILLSAVFALFGFSRLLFGANDRLVWVTFALVSLGALTPFYAARWRNRGRRPRRQA